MEDIMVETRTVPRLLSFLTHYQGNPDFVRQWLRDPGAVRASSFMSNLDWTEAEIQAPIWESPIIV